MRFRGFLARAGAALVLLAACAAGATASSAEAATPSLLWAGARQVVVNCLVQSRTMPDSSQLQNEICARVSHLAGREAPFEVRRAVQGDPAMVAADTVTLLVHASVERTPRGRSLTFTIRPHRPSGGEADILYGTAPRSLDLPSGGGASSLDSALSEALAEILPWQRPSGLIARPL